MASKIGGASGRVTLAILGAVLAGSIGAGWAAWPAVSSLSGPHSPSGPAALTAPSATPSQASQDQTPGGDPTATPTKLAPAPTATRAPTRAPGGQPGQQAHIQGTILSVSGSSFFLRVGGTTYIVNTNQSTIWQGTAQPGHDAEVVGVWQSSDTCLASSVHVEADA